MNSSAEWGCVLFVQSKETETNRKIDIDVGWFRDDIVMVFEF